MASWLILDWGNNVIGNAEEQTMVKVLQAVKKTVQNKGNHISIAELQSIPTEDGDFTRFYSRKPFPISELVKIIDALIKMLQGTWDETNYDMEIDYQY